MSDLRTAYLLPTGRCNLDCFGCYATLQHAGRLQKEGELTVDQYFSVIDELVQLGVTIFDISGGEPFLYPGLIEICERIRSHEGTVINLVSNGTRVTEKKLAQLAPLVHRLVVSLDAPMADLHDKIRGRKGAFEKAVGTIRRAKELSFSEVGTNFLFCQSNLHLVDEMALFCHTEKIDRLSLLTYRDVSENGVMFSEVPSLGGLTAAWRTASQHLERHEYPKNVDIVTPSFLRPEIRNWYTTLSPKVQARITLYFPHLGGKTAFRTTVVVKPHGLLTGDTAMSNDPHFDLGHVRNGVAQVWASQGSLWRKRLVEREGALLSEGPCRTCSRWAFCRGGCPAAARHQWGDDLHHDRTCDQFREAGAFN